MKLLALIVITQLAACTTPSPLREDFKRTRTELAASTYPETKIVGVCAAIRGADHLNANNTACSRWNRAEPRCEIFIVEPRSLDDDHAFQRIGHEVWHCLRGSFH